MALTAEQEAARLAAMARGAEPKPEARVLESNITPELCGAMAKFQADLPTITKNRRVDVETKEGKDDYGYDYATLEHVNTTVLPKLGALGMAFISLPTLGMDGRPALRCYLTHASGGYIAAEYPLRGEKYQQIGSAITYMRRYALQSATGVAAPEEDDGGQAADADTGTRTIARRARTETAATNTARANTAARARREQPQPSANTDTAAGTGERTAQRASAKEYGPPRNPEAPATTPQKQKIAIQFGELGFAAPARRSITGQLIGREVASSNELTAGEAHYLIDLIESAQQTPNPIQVLKDAAADVAARMAAGQPVATDADAEWAAELDAAKQEREATE